MKYVIHPRCIANIKQFYRNVAKKYVNTYSTELMHDNIDEAIDSMYRIENGLLRREPVMSKWNGMYMANTKKWYFAYIIVDDTVIVMDACQSQNIIY